MNGAEYSREQLRWLRSKYRRLPIPELTAAFNAHFGQRRTRCAIKSALNKRNYTCGRSNGNPRGTCRIVSAEQARWIAKAYRRWPLPQLTEAFNARFGIALTEKQIGTFVVNHGLRSGRTGYFETGRAPWNKGRSFPPRGRSAETQFKAGKRGPTWRPIGSETISSDGYLRRKVSDRSGRDNWASAHVLLWEQHHGPVPEGHVVIFVDGDKTHIELDNLALVNRGELAYLNMRGFAQLDPALRPTAINLARVEMARYRAQRRSEGKS